MLERSETFTAAMALLGTSRVSRIWEAAELRETIVQLTCLRGIYWTVCFVPRSILKVSAIDMLRLCSEIIAVCSQCHTKHINTLCGQNVELLNIKPVVHMVTTGV